MGYYWDKMMSEVGPVALAMSLLALWLLWVLSRRAGGERAPALDAHHDAEARRVTLRNEARSQVRARLTSAGLAVLESPQLIDKKGGDSERLAMDFVTVFGEGLWLLRVCPLEGDASGALNEERWGYELTAERGGAVEETLINPTAHDQRFRAVVKRIARSKKWSKVSVRYGVVYVGGALKVRSSEQTKVMSLAQLSKKVKGSASAPTDLSEARALWRVIRQRDLSQGEGVVSADPSDERGET